MTGKESTIEISKSQSWGMEELINLWDKILKASESIFMSPLNNSRLAESSQQHATKATYEQAYYEFVEQLIAYCNKEVNRTSLLQNLPALRIDLESFETVNLICESKKNVVKNLFLTKTIHLLVSELQVLEQQMRYPDFFKEKTEPEQINPLITLSSLPAGVNQIDIMEIASGIYYLLLEIGVPKVLFAFTHVARTFERLFGFQFDDIYKRREDVLKRTPQKKTQFLQRMIQAIIKESNKKGYL